VVTHPVLTELIVLCAVWYCSWIDWTSLKLRCWTAHPGRWSPVTCAVPTSLYPYKLLNRSIIDFVLISATACCRIDRDRVNVMVSCQQTRVKLRWQAVLTYKVVHGLALRYLDPFFGGGGTAAAVPPPFRPSDPALCGSCCPLVTPYYCRLGDLLCLFV